MFGGKWRKTLRTSDGQVTVLFALMLTVLLGAAAFTVDVGRAYFAQRSLQASADASALAAAGALPDTAQAVSLGGQYGGGAGGRNAVGSLPSVDAAVTPECLGTCGPSLNAVQVTQHTSVDTIFGRVLGIDSISVGVKAIACAGTGGVAYLVNSAASACNGGGGGGGGGGSTTAPTTTTSPATTTTTTTTTTTKTTTTGTTTPPITPGLCTLGYPYVSSNPLTSVTFSESTVLRAFAPNIATGAGDTIKVWYNDEHALTLGVRQIVVKTATGTSTSTYSISSLLTDPGSTVSPAVGATALTGTLAGTDPDGRPMFPALFITDVTNNPASTSGDWQSGGTPIPPNAVFGTWKGAVITVDQTKKPATRTITPDADPTKNNWSLGPGSDTPPSGLANEGYGAEARWNVNSLGLKPGHLYRMEFMVHDGDQNKTGGDSGEACNTVLMPG
ncbi:MAG: pilus assembly protein [Actinobacteria bacterium]|nr:pilus assembly protein [Actinomycetota bacterium]